MKYERMAGVSGAAVSLLFLAGCGGPEDVHNSKAELPPAVQKQVGGHVLQLVYKDAQGKIDRASAVRVRISKDKTIDITTAHTAAKTAKNCADADLIRKVGSKIEHFTPAKQSSAKDYLSAVDSGRSTSDRPELQGHDIAGIIKSDDEDKFGGIIPQESLNIQTGAIMTFVNYQEAPSGTSREVEREDKYGQPAEFTGRYIGIEGTKIVALTGDGTSYGTIDDKVTRKGSSGGAAFVNDKHASFAGITTNTSDYTVSREDVQNRFGVTMDVPSGSHLTYIEPVTADVVQELYQDALSQPNCISTN